MGKEIIRQSPDGDYEYDGDEENDTEYQEMMDNWRFELSTYDF